jgi:hypothetical protein
MMPSRLLLHFATSNEQAFLVFDGEGGKQIDYSGHAYQAKNLSGPPHTRDAQTPTWRSYTVSPLQVSIRRFGAIVSVFPKIACFGSGRRTFLISLFVIAKPRGHGGRRFAPNAFTEQGVAMLSSLLRSSRVVQVYAAIM